MFSQLLFEFFASWPTLIYFSPSQKKLFNFFEIFENIILNKHKIYFLFSNKLEQMNYQSSFNANSLRE